MVVLVAVGNNRRRRDRRQLYCSSSCGRSGDNSSGSGSRRHRLG